MEDRLARAGTGVDDDTVIVQPLLRGDIGDEVQHPLVFTGLEFGNLVEARDVMLGDDEQVRRRLRVDVADRDEALGPRDVVALGVERAEEAVGVRQRESPPP